MSAQVASEASAANRAAIIAVVHDRMITEGLEGFSMSDVAEAAGVTTATIYDTFGSRHELVAAAQGITLQEYYEQSDALRKVLADGPEALVAGTSEFVTVFRDDFSGVNQEARRVWLASVIESYHDAELRGTAAAMVSAAVDGLAWSIARGQQAGFVAQDVDAEALAVLLMSISQGLAAVYDLYGGSADLRERIIDTWAAMVPKPIAPAGAP